MEQKPLAPFLPPPMEGAVNIHTMSINLGKSCKHWDGTFNPDATHHEPSGPQNKIITGSDVKKKKRKRDILDITYVSSSNMEETPKSKKQKFKAQDTNSAPHIPKIRNTDVKDQENSVKKKRKKKYNQETVDITADDAFSSIVLYQETNEKKNIKKFHKAKATKRLHRDEHFNKETSCSHLTDLKGRSEKMKGKKDHGERLLDNNLVEESLTTDNQHANKRKKKQKGGGDLQRDDFSEKVQIQRKSPDCSETPKQVDTSLDQSETAIKKEKKKRKCRAHKETDDITTDDVYSSVVLFQEKNEKIKITHKAKDPKRLSRDEALLEESIYRELTDVNDRLSLKKKKKHKKDGLLENSLVEGSFTTDALHIDNKKTKWKDDAEKSPRRHGFTEKLVTKRKHQGGSEITKQVDEEVDQDLLIYHSRHVKKTKKWKGGGGLQDDVFTEELFSYRKSPDGSDAPEQVDECLDQVEKPIKKKKKKKRKDESHQEVEDNAVEDVSSSIGLREHNPSFSELNDTEDRPSHTVKKKSKKVHLEHPLEDNLVKELLKQDAQCTSKKKKRELKGSRDESHRQHGFTETTEQVVEIVDQTEVQVKKKVKNKKHLDRSEETSDISAEETQPEGGQSLQSRVVESDGNVIDREQTPTSGQSRPQTCASTDTDQNPATQDKCEEAQSEGDNGSATSSKNTEKVVVKRQYNLPFIQEQDLKLLEEYFPQLKSLSAKTVRELVHRELERIKIAKKKGIVFHSGTFTIEEDEQIKKNVQKFMSEFGIESAEMLFHPYKFPEQKNTIRKIKKTFQFTHRIAEGLHRTIRQVSDRGEVLYENSPVKGRYSEDEDRQLKMYLELHGKNWRTIGSLLNRNWRSCNARSLQLRHVNRGAWSKEETNRLIAAVKEFVLDSLRREKSNDEELVTVPKKNLYTGIKWVRIEEKVETRNYMFCRFNWYDIVMLRMNNGIHPLKGTLGIQNNIKMIKWMYESNVRDSRDLKWDKLCDDIGNIPTYIVQRKYRKLKLIIKGWEKMRLYEIVDCLYNEKLPKLEAKLSAAEEIPIEPKKKNKFLISEIFQEWSELDETWRKAGSTAKVRHKGGEGHPGDATWPVPSGPQCTDV
ncbi:transcription termination factor 1-like isoform X2 [Hyla sarda]|uniref:transcription termination factor 1-like isoform X2 n=1 Tax=Hyla sarda TaxID=327740 RepID=UPI0024C29C84|nr:transcription termination factor 1-like isoform X2 [Hyla sarda]